MDDSEEFSVKAMHAALASPGPTTTVPFYETVWKCAAPKKVQIFGWRLARKRINTADVIQRQNPHQALSPSCCILCHRAAEDIHHLFVDCPAASSIWKWLFGKLNINASSIVLSDFFLLHETPGKNNRWKEAVKTGVLAGFWALWLSRNKCIF